MPTVSVIVPNYNHAPFLKQRIDSILRQTYQDFELILLDDCSTDGSREIMESYRNNPHVSHIVYGESNSGSAFRQWDKGIALAKGEWIWVAESDDYCEPFFLERLMGEVARVPDCVLAYAPPGGSIKQGKKLWDTPHSDQVNIYNGQDFIRQKAGRLQLHSQCQRMHLPSRQVPILMKPTVTNTCASAATGSFMSF